MCFHFHFCFIFSELDVYTADVWYSNVSVDVLCTTLLLVAFKFGQQTKMHNVPSAQKKSTCKKHSL